MVFKNSKLIKKRNQKTKKDKNRNKVVKSLKSNNKRKTTKSNKKIKKFTKKTKKNKRHKSQIGGTLSDQSVMGIEIEVCIHPDYREIFKVKMEEFERKLKPDIDYYSLGNKESNEEAEIRKEEERKYGKSYSGWQHVTEDCICPRDDKFKFADNAYKKVYNNKDLNSLHLLSLGLTPSKGLEFASPKLSTFDQIKNYVNLFDGLFHKDNKAKAITVKKCGIHIHWSNNKFNIKDEDNQTKLFYKFHFMRMFYILERYFYKHLSEREIHGINGIYHKNRQFRGISPVKYFNPEQSDLDNMKIIDETSLLNYWKPYNPETAFNTFNQFPKNSEDINNLKLYRPTKLKQIITKSFIDYVTIYHILKNTDEDSFYIFIFDKMKKTNDITPDNFEKKNS